MAYPPDPYEHPIPTPPDPPKESLFRRILNAARKYPISVALLVVYILAFLVMMGIFDIDDSRTVGTLIPNPIAQDEIMNLSLNLSAPTVSAGVPIEISATLRAQPDFTLSKSYLLFFPGTSCNPQPNIEQVVWCTLPLNRTFTDLERPTFHGERTIRYSQGDMYNVQLNPINAPPFSNISSTDGAMSFIKIEDSEVTRNHFYTKILIGLGMMGLTGIFNFLDYRRKNQHKD